MNGRKRWTNGTALFLVGAVLITAASVVGFTLLLESLTPSPPAATQMRTAVTLVGVLGLAATAALAYRRQRLGEDQHSLAVMQDAAAGDRDRRDHEHTIDRDLRERFTVAASQLGSDSLPVRLAGVYAMATLADSWLEPRSGEPADSHRDQAQAQVCIDVLCGYVRAGDPSDPSWSSDSEVRGSIIRTLADRLQPPRRDGGISVSKNQAFGAWSWADIDIRGAHIDHLLDFSLAVFNGDFRATNAVFLDSVLFNHASFSRLVDFTGARFSGPFASFIGTKFEDCIFRDARFERSALFYSAHFSGGFAGFDSVSFEGDAFYNESRFETNALTFNDARFALTAVFSESRFHSRHVSFAGVHFLRRAQFNMCVFSGSEPIFKTAHFTEGANFDGSYLEGQRGGTESRVAFDPATLESERM